MDLHIDLPGLLLIVVLVLIPYAMTRTERSIASKGRGRPAINPLMGLYKTYLAYLDDSKQSYSKQSYLVRGKLAYGGFTCLVGAYLSILSFLSGISLTRVEPNGAETVFHIALGSTAQFLFYAIISGPLVLICCSLLHYLLRK